MEKIFRQLYRGAMALVGAVLVTACSDELPSHGDAEDTASSEVQFLVKSAGSVNISTRAGDEDPRNHFPIGRDFIEGRSRIRVCSVSRDPNTDKGLPDMDNAFVSMDEHPTGFHEYICSQRIEYGEYSIFNAYEDKKNNKKAVPLKWDVMNANGTVKEAGNIIRTEAGGGYYMYAAMFPFVYGPLEGSTQNSRAVSIDQTYDKTVAATHDYYAANLLMNDFRLCHKMFGRDQFRQPIRLDFYHILCMLVVNVELPIFNALDGTGFSTEAIAAANTMSINNVYCRFKPNYDQTYDRDDYVEVSSSAVESQNLESIQMFHTPNFACPDKLDGFVPTDAFWKQSVDHDNKPSDVAWTQFCVILPPQSFSDTDAYLSFEIGGQKYRCSLAGTPAIPLQQTYVTTLTLYIPREESDPVIIGAHLNDWEQYRTPIIPLQ